MMLQAGRWLSACNAGRGEIYAAFVIAALYLALLLTTVGDLGYARDEGFYFVAARVYGDWFALLASDPALALREVDRYFRVNAEHPALVKSLFALSHALFWEKWRIFSEEGTSYRFGGMLLSSMAVGVVYLWGARVAGRLVGFVAAASLAFSPRFFHHAHLACFDGPIVAMWTLSAYAYWRAAERGGIGRQIWAGIAFGLALDTKHNAWFLPIVCVLHALTVVALEAPERRRERLARTIPTLTAMALVGPLVFYALWPWIWHDTVSRLETYARFHLEHVYYNMEYLGSNYFEPPMPRSYAFVMTAATVPIVTLVAALSGFWVILRRHLLTRLRRKGELGPTGIAALFWLFALVVQYGAWLKPTTPIFGGTKHWMTAYPFLMLFAGYGVVAALRRIRRSKVRPPPLRQALAGLTLAAPLLTPVVEAIDAHPWALSFYTPLVGGTPGGASLGLNRGFWGYTTGAVAPDINRLVPAGGHIFIHDTAASAWAMLKSDGRIRQDIRAVGSPTEADVALYHHEMHMAGVEYQIWVAYDTIAPARIAGLHGVPVIWIYDRPVP